MPILLLRLGYSAFYRGDTLRSLAEAKLAAFRSNGDPTHESQSLGLLGEVEYAEGKPGGGVELIQHSAALAAANDFTW